VYEDTISVELVTCSSEATLGVTVLLQVFEVVRVDCDADDQLSLDVGWSF